MTQKTKKDDVHARIAAAQKQLKAVGKGSTNSFQGYTYTSAEDMLEACRSALLEQELVCFRRSWEMKEIAGELFVSSIVEVNCSTDPGENKLSSITQSFQYPVVPGKGRPLDKALSAALTTGLSYWLRDLFLLPRVDGNEVDSRDDTNYQHTDKRALHLAYEIEELATKEQMDKISGRVSQHLGPKGLLEQMDIPTLTEWRDKLKAGAK